MRESPDFVVTLVHGTFAQDAAWTREGSPICKALGDGLVGGAVIKSYKWSGRNRHMDRTQAGAVLRKQLLRQIDEAPQASHYIVAHSHGGNVALYALADPQLQSKIGGVICLNTPFIAVLRRNLYNIRRQVLVMTAAILIPLLLAAIPVTIRDPTIGGSVGLFIALLTLALLWTQHQRLTNKLLRRRDATMGRITLPEISSTRILAVSSAGDEVAFGFLLADAISSIPYFFLHYWMVGAFVAIFTIVYLLSPSLPTALGWGWEDAWSAYWFSVLLSLLFYFVAVGLLRNVFGWMLRIQPLGFAGLRIYDSLFIHLTTTLVPLTAHNTTFRDLELEEGLLSHSSPYEDQESIKTILSWITAIPSPKQSNSK